MLVLGLAPSCIHSTRVQLRRGQFHLSISFSSAFPGGCQCAQATGGQGDSSEPSKLERSWMRQINLGDWVSVSNYATKFFSCLEQVRCPLWTQFPHLSNGGLD